MASIGHVFVGMALGRLHAGPRASWRALRAAWIPFAALALLPDLDTLGLLVGVGWNHAFSHRGATHSLLLAPLVGAVAALVARQRGLCAPRVALLATAAVASHGMLDTMVDGGCGPALLWPITDARYWAPWRPIPMSPIGAHLISRWGMRVLAYESLLFSPVLLFALRGWRVRGATPRV